MRDLIKQFMQDESGQGLVEYALILVLIAVLVWATLETVGEETRNIFDTVEDELDEAQAEAAEHG